MPTIHFNEAASTAKIPFLYHCIFECDSSQQEFVIKDHDITLRIPEGTVSEGRKIHLEVAITMFGPFQFQENTRPISPFLWLCVLEEDFEFNNSIYVILPHFLTKLTKARRQCHQINIAKASHNDFVFEKNQKTYKFSRCDAKLLLTSGDCRSYGVMEISQCCFYCLEAKHTPELAADDGYSFVRIESSRQPNSNRNEVLFTAIYFLDTCLKVYSSLFVL